MPKLPQGVHIPPRLRQDRRDSGATAVVWKRLLACCPQPLGCPYPFVVRARPQGPGMTAVVWGMDPSVCPHNPHRASLSPLGPGRTGGTRVRPPLCGGGTSPCDTQNPPRGVPIPPWSRQDGGLGCSRRCVGEGAHTRAPTTPTGLPYPSAAPSGPEGLGWNRRCARGGPLRVSLNPHGASLPPRGPGTTGGTRVSPPLCGGGTTPCAPKPPRGVPIPPRPRGTGEARV